MQDLIAQAQAKQMQHLPFKYPLKASDKGVIFTFGSLELMLQITRGGMNLLFQTLGQFGRGDVRSKARELYYNAKYSEFVALLNQQRDQQVNKELWRKNQEYIIAVNKGAAYGVTANYNPKYNVEVLQDIVDTGMESLVSSCFIDHEKMRVYFEQRDQQGIKFGMVVLNGETGHTALSYRVYVAKDKYEFTSPTFGRRKHLGQLDKVDNSIKEVYNEIRDIEFSGFVLTAESREYAQLILADEKYEKLHELVEPYNSRIRKLYTLLAVLHTQHGQRGFKGVCSDALDDIYNLVMERL